MKPKLDKLRNAIRSIISEGDVVDLTRYKASKEVEERESEARRVQDLMLKFDKAYGDLNTAAIDNMKALEDPGIDAAVHKLDLASVEVDNAMDNLFIRLGGLNLTESFDPVILEGACLDDGTPVCPECLLEALLDGSGVLLEAKYHGRTVPLNKRMKGDVKKFKVYVKDPKTGNIKKVNFGDPNMKIKKYIPARRRSFRARHHCSTPGPKTKARYWSCKAW